MRLIWFHRVALALGIVATLATGLDAQSPTLGDLLQRGPRVENRVETAFTISSIGGVIQASDEMLQTTANVG